MSTARRERLRLRRREYEHVLLRHRAFASFNKIMDSTHQKHDRTDWYEFLGCNTLDELEPFLDRKNLSLTDKQRMIDVWYSLHPEIPKPCAVSCFHPCIRAHLCIIL